MSHFTIGEKQHWHVHAIQNYGGMSGPYGRGWDDQMTEAEARKLADDVIKADKIVWNPARMCDWETAEAEFGDNVKELVSSFFNPGWDIIWIAECEDPCSFDETMNTPIDELGYKLGAPYWNNGYNIPGVNNDRR